MRHTVTAMMMALAMVGGARADVRTWTGGGGDGLWSTAANWDGAVPGQNDTALFDNTADATVVDATFAGSVLHLTLTENVTGSITLGRSLTVHDEYTQAAGTFTAGENDLTVGVATIASPGLFTLSGGTFNAPANGNTFLFNSRGQTWTVDGGTFNHQDGTVDIRGWTVKFSATDQTFHHLTFGPSDSSRVTFQLPSTNTVLGDLTTHRTLNTGSLEIKGDLYFYDDSGSTQGTTWLRLTEPNTPQSIYCEEDAGASRLFIDKPGGTVTVATAYMQLGGIGVNNSAGNGNLTLLDGRFELAPTNTLFFKGHGATFEILGGEFVPGESTFTVQGWNNQINTDGVAFHDFIADSGANTLTLASGTTLTVSNHFHHLSGNLRTGSLRLLGDITVGEDANPHTTMSVVNAPLIYAGEGDQVYTNEGGNDTSGKVTVDKPGGRLLLNNPMGYNRTTAQDMDILAGEVVLNGNALNVGRDLKIGTDANLVFEGTEQVTAGRHATVESDATITIEIP